MSALESARNDGRIRASLQAAPTVYVSKDALWAFAGQDAASLFITSSAILTTDTAPADAFRLDQSMILRLVFLWLRVRNVPVVGR